MAKASTSTVMEMVRSRETLREIENLTEWSGKDIFTLAAREGYGFDADTGIPSQVGMAHAAKLLVAYNGPARQRPAEDDAPKQGSAAPAPEMACVQTSTHGPHTWHQGSTVNPTTYRCPGVEHVEVPDGELHPRMCRSTKPHGGHRHAWGGQWHWCAGRDDPATLRRSYIPNDEVDSTGQPSEPTVVLEPGPMIDALPANACPVCREQMIGKPRACATHGEPDYDDLVDAWHSGFIATEDLHEALGMTWDEYGRWANPLAYVPSAQHTCRTCDQPIEYHDPTGDGLASFYSHVVHPEDGHDAEPKVEANTDDGPDEARDYDGPVLSPSGDETEDGSAYVECTTHICEHKYEQDCQDAAAGDPLVSTACRPLEVAELASSTTPTAVEVKAALAEIDEQFLARLHEGWVPFGTHIDTQAVKTADVDALLDFEGVGQDGLPEWERLVNNRHLMERMVQYCAARGLNGVPVTDRCDAPIEEANELQEAWQRWTREATVDAFRALQREIADVVLAATVVAFNAQTTVEDCITAKITYDRDRARREALAAKHEREWEDMKARHRAESEALEAAGLV